MLDNQTKTIIAAACQAAGIPTDRVDAVAAILDAARPGQTSTPIGTGDLVTGKPSVAPNAGAAVPRKLLGRFETMDLNQAEWMRLPPPRRRCQLTGLSRTTLNELVERGDIRAITVRQPGAQRGVKLLHRQSLIAYLDSLDRAQNGEGARSESVPGQKAAPEGGAHE